MLAQTNKFAECSISVVTLTTVVQKHTSKVEKINLLLKELNQILHMMDGEKDADVKNHVQERIDHYQNEKAAILPELDRQKTALQASIDEGNKVLEVSDNLKTRIAETLAKFPKFE